MRNLRVFCLLIAAWSPIGLVLGAQSESAAPRTALQDFKRMLKSGSIVVVDVRSRESYLAGHIPGAISVPLESIPSRAAEMKKEGKPVVAYCS